MAAPGGKGGGRRKIFYTALCLARRHGSRGDKSASSHYFVKTQAPRGFKASKGRGCPGCRNEEINL